MRTQIVPSALVAVLGVWIGACDKIGGGAVGPPEGLSLDDPSAVKVFTGVEAKAIALTRFTGRPHTAEDVRRMGSHADVVLTRHRIDENERELAGLRALHAESGSPEAEQIAYLEGRIEFRRQWLSSLLSEQQTDGDGEPRGACWVKPEFFPPPISEVKVYPGNMFGVRVSGTGSHLTRGKNNQFVYPQIIIKNKRRGKVLSRGISEYDGTCTTTRSPDNRISVHVRRDLPDFAHMCAYVETEHRADNGYDEVSGESRDPPGPEGCKDLETESVGGPGNPILH